MKKIILTILLATGVAQAANSPDEVKAYLVDKLEGIGAQSSDFTKNAAEYAALAKSHGSIEAAYQADPDQVTKLVDKMQKNYKGMDSFGYETIEGIVAGVPSLAHYDITLDAGVPASEGPDDVAEVSLDLGNGKKIDRQGALFTYIIEPALWSGDNRWIISAGQKTLPKPEVLVAASLETESQIKNLQKDASSWKPTVADCFGAMIVMTPTLSDYFEDWKESRFSNDKSGRFQAVSRISDMKGIMGSCAVMYGAVRQAVAEKDKALAKSTALGFEEILAFLDALEKREGKGAIKAAEIEELARQAKEKTDKLVPQIEQGAALAGVSTAG